MSAQKAIISALYFSLIHESNTDVSSPPEYARTIFMRHILNREMRPNAKWKWKSLPSLDRIVAESHLVGVVALVPLRMAVAEKDVLSE